MRVFDIVVIIAK